MGTSCPSQPHHRGRCRELPGGLSSTPLRLPASSAHTPLFLGALQRGVFLGPQVTSHIPHLALCAPLGGFGRKHDITPVARSRDPPTFLQVRGCPAPCGHTWNRETYFTPHPRQARSGERPRRGEGRAHRGPPLREPRRLGPPQTVLTMRPVQAPNLQQGPGHLAAVTEGHCGDSWSRARTEDHVAGCPRVLPPPQSVHSQPATVRTGPRRQRPHSRQETSERPSCSSPRRRPCPDFMLAGRAEPCWSPRGPSRHTGTFRGGGRAGGQRVQPLPRHCASRRKRAVRQAPSLTCHPVPAPAAAPRRTHSSHMGPPPPGPGRPADSAPQ